MPEQENFGIISGRVLRDKSLSIESKAIYAYLCIFADKDGICNPSVSTICNELDICENRFYRHMKKLTESGIVTIKPIRDGTRFAKNTYVVARPTVPPSLRKSGTENKGTGDENHSSKSPSLNKSGMENMGTNSTNITSTRLLTNTNKDIYTIVCDLLNQAKAQAHSKGRLKPDEYIINQLRELGMSDGSIVQAAQDLADRGRDVNWFSLRDYCEAKGYIPRIERKNRR